MTRRYNLSHSAGQPMPEDWIHLPDSVVAATDYDALAQLVCDLWHSSAAAHIPPGLQKRVRDAAYAQSVEEQRFPHGAPAVQEVMCEACKGEGAYAGTDRICLTCSGLGTLRYNGSAPAEWPTREEAEKRAAELMAIGRATPGENDDWLCFQRPAQPKVTP